LSSQYVPSKERYLSIESNTLTKAYDNLLGVGFGQFRDTVGSYLSSEDQEVYLRNEAWDDIKLHVSSFIKKLKPRD